MKIENKKPILDYTFPYQVYCITIPKKKKSEYLLDKIYILIGTYENLIILDITDNNNPKSKKIPIFKNANINDIIQTKEGYYLLCSSSSNFKLIDIISYENEEKDEIYYLDTNAYTNADDIKILQEFNGIKNSKDIFVIKELSNGKIVSGDCEYLILWDKVKLFGYYEYKFIKELKLTRTYCILEIKKDKILLAVTQPDSQCILFINIDNNNNLNIIKTIENIETIANRKNIMKNDGHMLFIGCKDSLVIIDINKYEIHEKILYEKISYLNFFLNEFLICGIMIKENEYKYEGYLSQIKLESSNNQIKRIIQVSEYKNQIHDGSIIDGDIINYNGKDMIITIGTDNKLLILS